MFDYRYVYLMRKKKRSVWAKLTGQEQVKIGIAKSKKARLKQVDQAIKGDVELICAYKIPFAKMVESDLHKTFSTSRHTLKRVGKGAGKTEWFYLNWLEQILLRLLLLWYRYKWWLYCIICIVLYFYLK